MSASSLAREILYPSSIAGLCIECSRLWITIVQGCLLRFQIGDQVEYSFP